MTGIKMRFFAGQKLQTTNSTGAVNINHYRIDCQTSSGSFILPLCKTSKLRGSTLLSYCTKLSDKSSEIYVCKKM